MSSLISHLYVDLGANEGITIEQWLMKEPKSFVIGVEANPQLANQLIKKFEGDTRVVVYSGAADVKEGVAQLYLGKESNQSSTLLVGKKDKTIDKKGKKGKKNIKKSKYSVDYTKKFNNSHFRYGEAACEA